MIWLLPWDEDASVRHVPWATWSLIALNVLAYLFEGFDPSTDWYRTWSLIPAHPHWYAYISSSFVHFGLFHLVGNMLFLVVFGDNVEDAFGPLPFLLLYFLGGLLGDWMFMHANPAMDIPCAGASGCIATLAGAYLVLFFSTSIGVRVMFFVFPVHTFYVGTIWVLLFWFGADVFQTFAFHGVLPDGGGTNFVAHGAGFAVGVLVAMMAALFGVRRRYEELSEGHPWLGYWPLDPGKPVRKRPRQRPLPRTGA